MTTTDTDALTERIARALFEVRDDAYDLDEWEDLDSTDRERWMCDAAAVLPLVAVEARKAKAEAWDEAASHAESKSWITNFRADDLRTANPYEVTP